MDRMKPQNDIYYENLPTINRNVLVAEPTEVFLEWARKYPDEDAGLTLKELVADTTAYLIPEQEADAEAWLRRNFRTIFDIELDGWCTDPARWPADRSYKAFKKYFRVHFCSSAIDLAKGAIEREYI
jgi:hypothetical protein